MFSQRHIGPSKEEQKKMLGDLGLSNIDELVRKIVPDSILYREKTTLPKGCDEHTALNELKNISQANKSKQPETKKVVDTKTEPKKSEVKKVVDTKTESKFV